MSPSTSVFSNLVGLPKGLGDSDPSSRAFSKTLLDFTMEDEYAEEIFAYLRQLEVRSSSSPICVANSVAGLLHAKI